jgi:hypothetical protein
MLPAVFTVRGITVCCAQYHDKNGRHKMCPGNAILPLFTILISDIYAYKTEQNRYSTHLVQGHAAGGAFG